MYQEIKNNSNHQININENKETIINTQNSDMRDLDNSIYY